MADKYVDLNDVNNAALLIKDYCKNVSCDICIFGYNGGLDCKLVEPFAPTPKEWDIRRLG